MTAAAIPPRRLVSNEAGTGLSDAMLFDRCRLGCASCDPLARVQQTAGTAVFLASAASDYVNGQIIYVDGGMISVL